MGVVQGGETGGVGKVDLLVDEEEGADGVVVGGRRVGVLVLPRAEVEGEGVEGHREVGEGEGVDVGEFEVQAGRGVCALPFALLILPKNKG